jgi:hypothetical protein
VLPVPLKNPEIGPEHAGRADGRPFS